MKELFLIAFLCCSLSTPISNSLFEGVQFNKQGIGHKTNIPVRYVSFGKGKNDINTVIKDFQTTTALSFMYNNENYYISIEEKNFPNFVFDLKEGDLIFINIVVFDTTICHPTGRSSIKYCSYINKIERNIENKK
jgi:hypothetical protein